MHAKVLLPPRTHTRTHNPGRYHQCIHPGNFTSSAEYTSTHTHALARTRACAHTVDLRMPAMIAHICASIKLVLELHIELIARLIDFTTTIEDPGLHRTAHRGCFSPLTIPSFPHNKHSDHRLLVVNSNVHIQ